MSLFHQMDKLTDSMMYSRVFLEKTMDLLFETFKINQCFICLYNDNSSEYEVIVSRGKNIIGSNGNNQFNHYIVNKAISEKQMVFAAVSREDSSYHRNQNSKGNHNNKQTMCIPILSSDNSIGFIYINGHFPSLKFVGRDTIFLNALAQQIAAPIENIRLNAKLMEERTLQIRAEMIMGYIPHMHEISKIIDRVSKHDTTVLITGEIGTGKELIARVLHYQSSRKLYPFVYVPCTSFFESPDNNGSLGFIEEVLKDKLELANKGTLYLDEVGNLGLKTQAQLLMILEQCKKNKIDKNIQTHIDVRVIASSSKNLADSATNGTFREKLYYFLNPITIMISPLRSRKADIHLLAEYYVEKFCKQMGKGPIKIPQCTLDLLMDYDWPGNIKQFRNIIERAVALEKNSALYLQNLPKEISIELSPMTLEQMEKRHILATLKATGGNKRKTASLLNIGRATLYNKIKNMAISYP